MSFRSHVERAIAIHGSQSKLAREMGCSQQFISWLLKEAEQISAETAMQIDKVTGGMVRADEMRPDLPWPSPATQPNHDSHDDQHAHGDDGAPADTADAHEVCR